MNDRFRARFHRLTRLTEADFANDRYLADKAHSVLTAECRVCDHKTNGTLASAQIWWPKR